MTGIVGAEELRLLIERAERLEEEKRGLSDDIKDVMTEAKGRGFDPKAMRVIMRMRRTDPHKLREEQAILETYMTAMGMA